MVALFAARESQFFSLFSESAALSVQAANEFYQMLQDLLHIEKYSKNIKEIEHKADDITHHTIALLHKTFITPLDREDIHKLITEMDNIVDFIEAASQRMFLYKITHVSEDAHRLAKICVSSVEYVQKAVCGLNNLKAPENIIKNCVEINRLENEADHILRSAIGILFQEESDIRELIKLKEIYELLEIVTDRCEDVANVIEGIVLEYA